MPLAGIKKDGEFDHRRQAIGFWMFVEPIEVRPFKPVRVYVSSEHWLKLIHRSRATRSTLHSHTYCSPARRDHRL